MTRRKRVPPVPVAPDAGTPGQPVRGPSYLRALRELLPDARLVPTGGVDAINAPQYLAAGALAVGMGSTMFRREHLQARDMEAVERAARECVAAVAG